MVKRLIFDIDNTLIMWDEIGNQKGIKKVLDYYNLNLDSSVISSLIDDIEEKSYILTKESLLEEINNYFNLNLDMSFIDMIFEEQSKLCKISDDVKDVLEYLSKKYELVILTNYYEDVQIKRLENANIKHYFKEVYGGDKIPLKPNVESFEIACKNFSKESCLMIGDSIDKDIEGAINYGIKAIACDFRNKIPNSTSYIKIKDIKELKHIL